MRIMYKYVLVVILTILFVTFSVPEDVYAVKSEWLFLVVFCSFIIRAIYISIKGVKDE
jgi:hypothetical protein